MNFDNENGCVLVLSLIVYRDGKQGGCVDFSDRWGYDRPMRPYRFQCRTVPGTLGASRYLCDGGCDRLYPQTLGLNALRHSVGV